MKGRNYDRNMGCFRVDLCGNDEGDKKRPRTLFLLGLFFTYFRYLLNNQCNSNRV